MKKSSGIPIIIICALIALIPTMIAVVILVNLNTNPVANSTVDKVEIVTPYGESFEVLKGNDNGFIDYAISMNESAQKAIALPDQLYDAPYFTFTFYSYDKATEYKYYFSSTNSDAYYTNANGVTYKILSDSENSAKRFLSSEYAHCLYDYNDQPAYSVNGKEIYPASGSWSFKGMGEDFYEAKLNILPNEQTIMSYGIPTFEFPNDLTPDELTVKLVSNGEQIYEGFYENFIHNDFSGKQVEATVNAKWFKEEGREFFGDLVYNFNVDFKKPPMFFISSNSAVLGDVLTISALNVDDPKDIVVDFEPTLGTKPVFSKDGEYAKALIPISTSVIPGSYQIKLNYNGQQTPTVFNVDLQSKYTASYPYKLEDTLYSALYNDENVKAYKNLFASFFEKLAGERYFDGNFSSGLPNGTFESADFGDVLTIDKNSVSFENKGIYYTCNSVTSIRVVNNGEVIYAGEDKLAGKIVAVDHGLGLVSVYSHLGEISVKKGDRLIGGDVIGKSGRTGLISKKAANYTLARVELYVDKIAVDIEPLIANGIVFAGNTPESIAETPADTAQAEA